MCRAKDFSPRPQQPNLPPEAPIPTTPHKTNVGELISTLYPRLLEIYGDEKFAAVITSTIITDILSREKLITPDSTYVIDPDDVDPTRRHERDDVYVRTLEEA